MQNSVLQSFSLSNSFNKTLTLLKENKSQCIQINKLVGSGKSVFIASLFDKISDNMLLLFNNKEEAAFYYNDLQKLVAKENTVYFFPASYRESSKNITVENANILQRAEVLNALSKSQHPKIIVSFVDALIEKIVSKSELKQHTLQVKVGEKLNIEFINELLYSYEFERVDFVAEPGQFSVRGGIVDVYSFSNDYPYRIEFFGDEIDSIRSFDVATQLSIAHFKNVQIIPNLQSKIIAENKVSLHTFMGTDTICFFNNAHYFIEKIEQLLIEKNELFEIENNAATLKNLFENIYISKTEFITEILNTNVIELGTQSFFKANQSIDFNGKPQPSFNKDFVVFKNHLQDLKSKDYNITLYVESPKQIERLYQIFEDLPNSNSEAEATENEVLYTSINHALHEGFYDEDLKIVCYTDHQLFERYQRYKLKEINTANKQAITLKELMSLQVGDFVTHIDHGVGRFSGLEKVIVKDKEQEVIRLVYKDGDMLYVSIHALHKIAKYAGSDSDAPKLHKIGSPAWALVKAKTKKKVKEIAFDLIKLYAARKALKGFAFSKDNYLQHELEASFIYEDTPDQIKSTLAVKQDMESEAPMDRLICGDVGFGKTEIAIRAAFKAACDGKQVAILVPTTILALQHYKTFKNRLQDFPVTVDYLNRFKTTKQENETLENLKNGKVDIVIGTHRLLSKDIKYKNIGLLIIDEEQKFGVAAKDKLKTIKTNLDTLTLSATPIPRTLQFSMMGARDLSVITTPPPNRFPVETTVVVSNPELIRDAVSKEIQRGGQVFFIHNRVANIQEIANLINALVPDAKVNVAHGQMEGDKLEDIMLNFIEGNFDVLVATTIIESGLDIPNANTIIINHAENFGLSDLHQMRGRVGRSNKKAYCYLLTPPNTIISNEAQRRLRALEEFSDLGSGFNIAMKDLDIRGAGNLLGGEQSGFISEIGFEMYQKILDEAVQELKEEEFADLFALENNAHIKSNISATPFLKAFVVDCIIDTDLSIHFPTSYIESSEERLVLYKELDDLKNEEALQAYELKLMDRFGAIPSKVEDLLLVVKLRWLGKQLGFEKIILKQNKMIAHFIAKQESPFYKSEVFMQILQYMQKNQSLVKIAEKNNKLTLTFLESVKSVKQAISFLEKLIV